MNTQTVHLILNALLSIDVYSWILSVVGATLTTFWPEKDDVTNKEIKIDAFSHLLAITGGALFGKFFTFTVMNWLAIVNHNPPVGFLVLSLLGNGIVQFVIKLGRKLGSDANVDVIYDLIKNFIINKFTKK